MEPIPLRTIDEEECPSEEEEPEPPNSFIDFLYAQTQGLGASLIVLSILSAPIIVGVLPNLSAVSFRTCMDGNFRVSDISSPWDPRTIFAISLGFGSFEFTVAKGIDVAFDLIVGRGGQLLLSLIAYPVFTDMLLYSMETRSATYAYFSAIAFDTVSVSTMSQISKDLCRQPKGNRSLRTVLIPIGLLLASVYILAFPTLASAATGYITSQDPVVPLIDDEGTTASWPGEFRPCAYVIEDADRLPGLNSSQCILYDNGNSFFNQTSDYYIALQNGTWTQNSGSRFGETKLDAPALTIHQHAGYSLGDSYYPKDYLEQHGYCRPNDNKYKWGFSYLLLFIMIVLTYIWAGILTAMHVEIRRKGQLARYGRRLGLYRAVLDLSKAIREELGEEAQLFSNDKLEKLLTQAREGIRYKVPA